LNWRPVFDQDTQCYLHFAKLCYDSLVFALAFMWYDLVVWLSYGIKICFPSDAFPSDQGVLVTLLLTSLINKLEEVTVTLQVNFQLINFDNIIGLKGSFYIFPGFILIWWYPDLRFNLENNKTQFNSFGNSSMLGIKYLSFRVSLLSAR
jgi:hypothetical protein